jgi:hypothetical protein
MKILKNINRFFYNSVPAYFLSVITGLLIFSCAANVSAAEYVYISDHLRVGVRTEPVAGIPPISVVFTGMRLEVHDRTGGYVKVTTDKGISGWIKDIYVTKKAPAIIQLNSFQAKYDKLNEELAKGKEATVLLEKANIAFSKQMDEFKTEQHDWMKERAALMEIQHKESLWFWFAKVIIFMLLGFVAGVFWYKAQVTKRLGGLRF